jgi:hypothetical protein
MDIKKKENKKDISVASSHCSSSALYFADCWAIVWD